MESNQDSLTVPSNDSNRLIKTNTDSPMYPNHHPDLLSPEQETMERRPSRFSFLSRPATTDDDSRRRPSRFSFLGRPSSRPEDDRSSRFSFLRRPSSRFSFLSRPLTRPPSYRRYTNPDQEAQHAADVELCRRLESYHQEDGRGILYTLLWKDSNEPRPKHLWRRFFTMQFTGFYMAFWVIVFVFIGAVSVFVPGLPPLAKLLWLPLALYCIGVMVYHGYHQRQGHKLEQQLNEMRQRRLDQLRDQNQLPMDHYFVTASRPGHTAQTTLIPPPPMYHSPTIHISPA